MILAMSFGENILVKVDGNNEENILDSICNILTDIYDYGEE